MNKEEFVKKLSNMGYIISEENGVPIISIIGSAQESQKIITAIKKFVKESSYNSSYGFRYRNTEKRESGEKIKETISIEDNSTGNMEEGIFTQMSLF